MNKESIGLFLESYGFSGIEFERLGGGISSFTLLVKTKDKKYVLKIADKDSNLVTEVEFGNFLHLKGFPTAKVIKNKRGEVITCIEDLRGALFGFCEGEPITLGNLSEVFSKNAAELLAKMHALMMDNRKIPASDYNGYELGLPDDVSDRKIMEERKLVMNEIENIDFSEMKRALIHGDLTRRNFLIGKDKETINAIIDFGDAHYDFIAWDMAIMMTHVFITKTYGIDYEALKIFFREYNHLFPLNREEKRMVITFMKARNINLAIEVNRIGKTEKNTGELSSIEDSVMTKLKLIREGEEALRRIFNA